MSLCEINDYKQPKLKENRMFQESQGKICPGTKCAFGRSVLNHIHAFSAHRTENKNKPNSFISLTCLSSCAL